MQSEIGFLMVKGSVGSSVNFLTPRTTAAHRPSSRDKRMFSVFCFSIHGTHGPESNFAYYRMMAGPALYLPILLRGYSQTGFVRQPSPEPLKSLQTPLKPSFHPPHPPPRAGTQPNGIIWVRSRRENWALYFYTSSFVSGERQKAEPVERIFAGVLNRGAPFGAVYEHPSSKTHTNHIPVLPVVPVIRAWWQGGCLSPFFLYSGWLSSAQPPLPPPAPQPFVIFLS